MGKGRLEAFSDGVIAIIITIMVLELRAPHDSTLAALHPLIPVAFCYVLSFAFVAIYWNNHHHMFHVVQHVNGTILWANMHLLFWLSLIPFSTDWMGQNHFAPWPVAVYGINLLMAGIAYYILAHCLMERHGKDSILVKAFGTDFKGKISVVGYAVAIPCAFVTCWISVGIYVAVALLWIVPDRRVEKALGIH